MKPSPKDISPIGQRLKALRQENGWTLAYVSEKTGISQGTLSKLERGRTNLNFTSVNKLAEGLGIPVMSLTNPTRPKTARRSITPLGGGTVFQHEDVDYEVLCNDLTDKSHGYLKAVIKSHDSDEIQDYRRHDGQEFVYVLRGTLELHTEFYDPVTLKTGDSIMFDSSMGHKYISKGRINAEILIGMSLANYKDVTDTLSFHSENGSV